MGIKGLRFFLKSKNCLFEEDVHFSFFKGKKIAIDASYFIYKFKALKKDLFLEEFIKLILIFYQNNIQPIFIFDGIPPKEKKMEREKRSLKKKEIINKIEILQQNPTNAEQKKKILQLENCIVNISKKDFDDLKFLLTNFGVLFITAKEEAEIFSAELVKKKIVDAVMTKDSDVLACSAPLIISDFNILKKKFTIIRMKNILTSLQINEKSWLDFCILCGTDFNTNIYQIGPVKAFKYIEKYKDFENMKKEKLNIIPNYIDVRKIFQPKIPENFEIPLEEKNINSEEMYKLIKNENLDLNLIQEIKNLIHFSDIDS